MDALECDDDASVSESWNRGEIDYDSLLVP